MRFHQFRWPPSLGSVFFVDHRIVRANIKVEAALEAVDPFGCAPGPARQALKVVADHGAGVVQRKEWIPAACF